MNFIIALAAAWTVAIPLFLIGNALCEIRDDMRKARKGEP